MFVRTHLSVVVRKLPVIAAAEAESLTRCAERASMSISGADHCDLCVCIVGRHIALPDIQCCIRRSVASTSAE